MGWWLGFGYRYRDTGAVAYKVLKASCYILLFPSIYVLGNNIIICQQIIQIFQTYKILFKDYYSVNRIQLVKRPQFKNLNQITSSDSLKSITITYLNYMRLRLRLEIKVDDCKAYK